MSPQEIQMQLQAMKGKTFTYMGKEHVIKSFHINNASKEFRVKTSRFELTRTFGTAQIFFDAFQPVNGAKVTPAKEPAKVQLSENGTEHTPSSVIVYSTTDYSRFKMINGNRGINMRKVAKIIKEIEGGNDMLRYYPIQVKENDDRLDILDGQHRFYIDKKLKRPVYYILVEEEKTMPEIAMINSNVEKWKPEDFINCYMNHGNKNYEILKTFLDRYDFSLSVALVMLKTGTPGSEQAHRETMEAFRNGTFIAQHIDKAEELGDMVHLFNEFSNFRSRAFVIAIYKINKAGLVAVDEICRAYKERPEMLTQQANYKAYVNTLEQIYNFKKSKRVYIT